MYAELHPGATREIIAAGLFYEDRSLVLGTRFVDEVERAIDVLLRQPQIGSRFAQDLRHFVLDDFPFSLIYRVEQERIWILAVAHHSRRPGYWQDRIER